MPDKDCFIWHPPFSKAFYQTFVPFHIDIRHFTIIKYIHYKERNNMRSYFYEGGVPWYPMMP